MITFLGVGSSPCTVAQRSSLSSVPVRKPCTSSTAAWDCKQRLQQIYSWRQAHSRPVPAPIVLLDAHSRPVPAPIVLLSHKMKCVWGSCGKKQQQPLAHWWWLSCWGRRAHCAPVMQRSGPSSVQLGHPACQKQSTQQAECTTGRGKCRWYLPQLSASEEGPATLLLLPHSGDRWNLQYDTTKNAWQNISSSNNMRNCSNNSDQKENDNSPETNTENTEIYN